MASSARLPWSFSYSEQASGWYAETQKLLLKFQYMLKLKIISTKYLKLLVEIVGERDNRSLSPPYESVNHVSIL